MDRHNRLTSKRWFRIGVALTLILIGMALLPLVALPYGALDWLIYDPAYKGCAGYPTAAPCPALTPAPVVPCAELPRPGELLVASVNGQGIPLRVYERELDQFLDALVALGADPQSDEFQTSLPTYRRQVLDLLIEDVLIQQAAMELHIVVSQQQIAEAVAQAVAEGGGPEAFQSWLDETGQSWEEFRRDTCQDLLRRAVMERVTAGMPTVAEMVHARQIVVASEGEAVAVLSRLAQGESFEKVAAAVSLDEQTRQKGGDLGWFPRGLGRIPPEVEDAAFGGTVGQVQGPIPVDDRYVIIQVVEHQNRRPLDEEMRGQLQALAFEEWLAVRRETAQIDIYIEFEE